MTPSRLCRGVGCRPSPRFQSTCPALEPERVFDEGDDGFVAIAVQHVFGDPQLQPTKAFHEQVAGTIDVLLPLTKVVQTVVFD